MVNTPAQASHPQRAVQRLGSDGRWPEQTEKTGEDGMLTFDSIGFECPLPEVYARTHLGSRHTP